MGFPEQRLGGSLALTTLASGTCSVIQQELRTFDPADYECPDPIERLTQVPSPGVFWRGTTGSFEVLQDGEVLAECLLATRTQPQTCEITLRAQD